MSKEERKVPELRFRGFHDDWEQRKLNTVVERVTRKNKNNESTLPLTISAQDGLVDQNTYFNKRVASKDMSNYYLLKKGDFAYNKSYSNGFPLGTVKRLEKYEQGALSSLYIVFKPQNINSDFLSIYYDTNKWHREVMKLSAEGARNHGLLNIPVNSFFEKNIIIPIIKDEQLNISEFLKRLEKIINLHQRKINILLTVKKAYLREIFPLKGRNKPNLRFNHFNEEWEQRKFKELVDRVSASSENMDLPRVEYEDIISDRGILNKDLSLKISDKKGTMFLPKDILFGKLRPYLNKWLYSNFKGIAVGDFWILRSKEVESIFIFYMLQTNQFKLISNISSGSKMPRSDWNIVSNSTFAVPLQSSEDRKIGLLLSTIENLITLHQGKVNILNKLKNLYLHKMFL